MHSLNEVCCPYHPDSVLIEDDNAGDMICPECGLVVGDRVIDVNSEWGTLSISDEFDPNDDLENPHFGDFNLSTSIGPDETGADTSLEGSGASKYYNRQKISNTERTLMMALKEMSAMADCINLPKAIVDRAHNLFKQMYQCRRIRVRRIGATVSACLYIACRQEGAPRTFNEISAISKVGKKDIGRCFISILKTVETTVENIKSADFMSRFGYLLQLPIGLQSAATHIAKKAVDLDIVPGRSPISVAAAALYMVSQASALKKTRSEISDITGVTKPTIRLTYRNLLPHAAILFPQDFVFTTKVEYLPDF